MGEEVKNLLKDHRECYDREGYDWHGLKDGVFKTLRKWHYFRGGRSLCGKYVQCTNDLLSGGLFDYEICKLCLKILKEEEESKRF